MTTPPPTEALSLPDLADKLAREVEVRRNHPNEYCPEITGWIEQAAQVIRGVAQPSREAREKEITRLATIEVCARELEISYPDHTWLNAACAAIRSLKSSDGSACGNFSQASRRHSGDPEPGPSEARSAEAAGEAVARIIDGYADSYRMMANDGDGRILASSVHTDLLCNIKPAVRAALASSPRSGQKVAHGPADEIIGQIEERFPNWRSFRDLVDCIDCTLHNLRGAQR